MSEQGGKRGPCAPWHGVGTLFCLTTTPQQHALCLAGSCFPAALQQLHIIPAAPVLGMRRASKHLQEMHERCPNGTEHPCPDCSSSGPCKGSSITP